MYWPSLQGLIFKWKTKELMALLNYLIWKDNGLYYLQSWLQEKFYHFISIYDKKQTLFSSPPFFSPKWEVIFFLPKTLSVVSLPVNSDQNYFMVNVVSAVCILQCFFLNTCNDREKILDREFIIPGKVITAFSRILFEGINLNQRICLVLG